MLVGAYDGAVDDQVLEVRVVGHRCEDAPPDALLTPATEAPEDAVPVAEHLGQVSPGLASPHDPQHTLDEHPVVASCRALLVGPTDDQARHPIPSSVAQHQTIQHTQDHLPKRSLESRFAPIGNP